METTTNIALTSFAQDVDKGLSATPKYLPSSYFYDEQGSKLFQQIMDLPEYYLSRAEADIFKTYAAHFLTIFQTPLGFDLVELGAGDGSKTAILLKHFLAQKADFSYKAIDISPDALLCLAQNLQSRFPTLALKTIADDYFAGLDALHLESSRRKVVLFLGSTIGNFTHAQAVHFLKELRQHLTKDDLLCIGFDLKKDPSLILAAYNDAQGVTANFNYNLLQRMNQELGANFEVENFMHAPIYHPLKGCAESFLVSKAKQNVYIEALEKTFEFEEWEAIHTEVSYKYSLQDIKQLATFAGLKFQQNFYDSKNFFCNAIFNLI